MMNRRAWWAVPVAGLAVVSLGLAWWGTNQHTQKAAMATEIDNRYSNSFHELSSHVQDLKAEIGKARVSVDASMFRQRLRSIWRLSGLAQDEVGKIPLQMMPLHQTQSTLADISKQTDNWLKQQTSPTSQAVQTSLNKMYKETQTMSSSLQDLQTKMLNQNLHWTAALAALDNTKQDNQIVDGFRKMDKSMGAFVETGKLDTHPTAALAPFKQESTVSESRAQSIFKNFLKGSGVTIQSAKKVHHGQLSYYSYDLHGKIGNHTLTADVSRNGGHVLSYQIERTPAKKERDLGEAQAAALKFIKQHGFKTVTQADAYQLNNIGYFVYNPVVKGAVVVSQNIVVEEGLDNDNLPIAFNAQQAYVQPVKAVPTRRYSTQQLRKVVNPNAHIELTRKTIVLDNNNHFQPAVSFYVTRDGATYRVDVNAANGKEIDMTDLSTK